MKQLIKVNPDHRIKADKIMNHLWFTKFYKAPVTPKSSTPRQTIGFFKRFKNSVSISKSNK